MESIVRLPPIDVSIAPGFPRAPKKDAIPLAPLGSRHSYTEITSSSFHIDKFGTSFSLKVPFLCDLSEICSMDFAVCSPLELRHFGPHLQKKSAIRPPHHSSCAVVFGLERDPVAARSLAAAAPRCRQPDCEEV